MAWAPRVARQQRGEGIADVYIEVLRRLWKIRSQIISNIVLYIL